LSFECPLLVPVSRKTVIGEVLDLDQPKDRDAGTAACVSASIRRGASIVRVHDVKMAYQTVCALNSIVG
ncbi:MAG: dihydropteroate synthase, partial [Verrucomicrobiales bacterium]